MKAVLLGNKRVVLDDRFLIGEGGEGRVYRIGDLAVKIFTTPDKAREDKLRAFPKHLPPHVIAPLELCIDPKGSRANASVSGSNAAAGSIVGFAMRALDGAVDLSRLSQRRWRESRVDNGEVLRVFRDLGGTIDKLHAHGVVVGDLNDGNVMITAPTPSPTQTTGNSGAVSGWTPWLIDADSMQFGAYPCVVAHERFLDPRLFNIDLRAWAGSGSEPTRANAKRANANRTNPTPAPALSRESDWYALAVLLFGSLLYIHPFGGAHPSHPTMLRRAEARVSVLRSDVKLPNAAARPDVLPDDALAWFERVFERDQREPLPSSVLEMRFARCSCGAEHARATCPVCRARVHVVPIVRAKGRIRATRIFRTDRGRIVAVVVQNGLKHAHEEDGSLLREDGSVVLRSDEKTRAQRSAVGADATAATAAALANSFFTDPNRVVRIAGTSTWVGTTVGHASSASFTGTANRSARIHRIVGERIVDSFSVGLVRGELAADAGLDGLVSVDGDVLMRLEAGTRIGQVLEGQTYVRVSAGNTMGFAFYRAGEITVAFVFDPRRGTLRQIDSFPRIEGKLLGWSAVFDDAHVLVTFATENNVGHVVHTAHLVDSSGEVVASEKDPTSPIARSLSGRAIAGGNVIVASDDGLVLLKPDRRARAFVSARLFPEGKDFASPEDELLVGPGGSLFAVTHDEITHLSFTA